VRHEDPDLAIAIAESAARQFVDDQIVARLRFVDEYRDALARVDRRSLLPEPPDPSTILSDPLHIVDVTPAVAIAAEPETSRTWLAPLTFAAAVAAIGIALAVSLEWTRQRVFSDRDVESAGRLRRLGFRASTPVESAASVAVDVSMELRRAGTRGVVITSPGRSDGKTTVAVDVARFLGASGHRVTLVESDLLGDGVAGLVGVPNLVGGLCHLFETNSEGDRYGVQSLLVPTSLQGVRLLPRGDQPAAVRPHIGSDRMSTLYQTLLQISDFVVFDSPAACHVHDAASLSRIIGASVLVVREGWTSIPAVRAAVRNLEMMDTPILGFVYVERTGGWSRSRSTGRVTPGITWLQRMPVARAIPAIAHILLPGK
jgi:Mrp family chromosome partitioning ATPase